MAFIGTYTQPLDGKGRVTVPAGFRSRVSQGGAAIVLAPDTEAAITAFDAAWLEKAIGDSGLRAAPFERDGEVERLLAAAYRVAPDTDGRIVLPASLIDYAGLEHEVLFVGLGERFQLWQPERFNDHQTRPTTPLR